MMNLRHPLALQLALILAGRLCFSARTAQAAAWMPASTQHRLRIQPFDTAPRQTTTTHGSTVEAIPTIATITTLTPANDPIAHDPIAHDHHNSPYEYSAEVVGGGRFGSFWSCYGTPDTDEDLGMGLPIVTPRGVAPGSQTAPGCPIYVATPGGDAWEDVYANTDASRREDLVLLGNGIAPWKFADATVCIPHYAVVQICNTTSHQHYGVGHEQYMVGTSPVSPPTYVYGKHADAVSAVLNRHGVRTESIQCFDDVRVAAAVKLMWASLLWIFCHLTTPSCTIGEAHEIHRDQIEQVVEELLPALDLWHRLRSEEDGDGDEGSDNQVQSKEAIISYLEAYSKSVGSAVQKLDLDAVEIASRNGFWLKHQALLQEEARKNGDSSVKDVRQTLHFQLVEQVAGKEKTDLIMKEIGLDADSANNNDAIATAVHDTPSRMVKLPGTQLRLSATSTPEAEHTNGDSPQQDSHPTPRNIVVVGGGIMGASVAMQLARLTATAEAGTNSIGNVRKTTITVVDLAPTTQDHATVGRPTRAWLHASGKTTKHYQRMNQWGLQSWKEDPALRKLPSWTGSLARFATPNDDQTDADGSSAGPLPAFLTDGGYAVEGPLTKERLRELKPIADWNMSGQQEVSATDETDVYYFADEGTVDPDAAARTCRDEAESLGVVFLKNCDATGLVWSDRIEGVQCGPYDRVLPADVVVVAGDAAGALGDLPQDGLPVVGYLSNADGSGNSGVYSLVNHSGVTLGPLLGSMAAVEILRNVQLDVLKKYRPSRFGK